jgi:hypothetical protein
VVSGDSNHIAVITSAQLAARQAVVIDIKGTSSHGHLVEVKRPGDRSNRRHGRVRLRVQVLHNRGP